MSVLDYAIRIIKATMKNHSNESFFPYFFIVGAGISVPEIPAAYEIIDECKDKSKKFDEISYIQFENEIKSCETNPMRCYSKWIEFAYPNRIDRSNLFKRLNATAKISSANVNSHRPNISSVISGYKQPSKSAQSIEITGFIEKSKPSQIIFLYTLLPLTA